MDRISPLPIESLPEELQPAVERYSTQMGFVPNSFRTMARRPKIARAYSELSAAVAASLTIPPQMRLLIFHVASYAAGCRYCQAHSIGMAAHDGAISAEKAAAVWEYETSPLFGESERAALRFAQAAGVVPNAVTGEHFAALREHYSDDQIVEVVAIIAWAGFLNRWNDTMATELEEPALVEAERLLGAKGWEVGKHVAG